MTTLGFDPVAALVVAVAVLGYLAGVRRAKRSGVAWPRRSTVRYLVFGVGSYAVLAFGFFGVHSATLRWAFVVRLCLLLLIVPMLMLLGRPVALLRAAVGDAGGARVDAVLRSRALRVVGSWVVAPLIPLAVFVLLLTHVAGFLRVSAPGQLIVTVLVPIVGLVLAVALDEGVGLRSSTGIATEFLFAFIELLVDALPGILMRLAPTVLDGVGPLVGAVPHWYPNPLRDQQLAGGMLWFVAEAGDLPVLIMLFVRWAKIDRREARSFDDLSDEEYDAMTRRHLRGDERAG